MATRAKPIAVFPTHDNPVRLYAPTAKSRYYRATFYLPGVPGQQSTTLGRERGWAVDWAEAKAAELRALQGLSHADRPYATVAELVTAYLDQNRRRWKHRTSEKNAALARLLPKSITSLQCRQLSEECLQEFLDTFAEGHATSYTRTMRSLLTGMVRFGRKRSWLLPDQMRDLELTVAQPDDESDDGSEIDPGLMPTHDDFDRLIAAIASPIYRLMCDLTLGSGFRFAEVIALRKKDVDLATGKIRVRQTIVQDNSGRSKLSSTKNRRTRTVAFDIRVLPAMAARLRELDKPDDLLFTAPRGGWISRNNFNKRIFRPAVLAAGLNEHGVHFHTLRHAAATDMLERGVSMLQVSEILGHSNPGITERIYARCRRDYADDVAAAFGWPPAA